MYIGIILWQDKYLDFLIPSLVAQTETRSVFHLHDQSPNQEGLRYIQKNFPELEQDSRFKLSHGANLFHSGGHNLLIKEFLSTRHRFYICASQDMWYDPNFFHDFGKKIKKQSEEEGTATVKSYHWDYVNADLEDIQKSKTKQLDSCGIKMTPSWVFSDLGQGKPDQGQYDRLTEVIGGSGALVALSKDALNAVSFQTTEGGLCFFDPMIHYKNDIELAIRLQRAGFRCRIYPELHVYHDRQATSLGQAPGIIGKIKYRWNKSRWERESSFWGQLVTVRKHYSPQSLGESISHRFHWCKVMAFVTIFEPFLWKQYAKLNASQEEIKHAISQQNITQKDLSSFYQK